MKLKRIFFPASIFLLSGCVTTGDLSALRKSTIEDADKIKTIERERVLNIQDGSTLYSKPLECVGRVFDQRSRRIEEERIRKLISTGKVKVVDDASYSKHIAALREQIVLQQKIIADKREKIKDVDTFSKKINERISEITISAALKQPSNQKKTTSPINLRTDTGNLEKIKNENFKKIIAIQAEIDAHEATIRGIQAQINSPSLIPASYAEIKYESSAFKNYTWAVAPIYDKTGKVYPQMSTAVSEMLMESLSKLGVNVIETPLTYELSSTRTAIANRDSKNAAFYVSANHLPVGDAFPSNFYIAGAIIAYDDVTEAPAKSYAADVNIVKWNKSVSSVKVVLNLRIVHSKTGLLLKNRKANEDSMAINASIQLTTNVLKIRESANIFKVSGDQPYGFDYLVNVGDPVQYAILEVVQKGLYNLLETYISDQPTGCDKELVNVQSS